eukprot:scaffold104109_cov20-Prasinocladus_malaysianus.AAC.1
MSELVATKARYMPLANGPPKHIHASTKLTLSYTLFGCRWARIWMEYIDLTICKAVEAELARLRSMSAASDTNRDLKAIGLFQFAFVTTTETDRKTMLVRFNEPILFSQALKYYTP